VGHQSTALARLKRGGGRALLSLNGEAGSIDQFLLESQASDPEAAFESAWRVELLDQAIERIKSKYADQGRDSLFAVFEEYALGSSVEKPTYEQLAERYGLTLIDVRKGLSQVRHEIRQEILAELVKLAGSHREAQDEWKALFGA
jgi:hypothetical protein